MAIAGLIFDFDGLIVDTEIPAMQSWQEIYEEYGCSLPVSEWSLNLGGSGVEWDPCVYLESQAQCSLNHDDLRARRWERKLALTALQPVLSGLSDYFSAAKRLGLRLGIASSSRIAFVGEQLDRLELRHLFDEIVCRDDAAEVKPNPELYLTALTRLGIPSDECIAFEDSPNGVTAAKRAGLFCVAVPNELTGQFPLNHADLQLKSLADLSLEDLLTLVEQRDRV